MRWIEYLQVNIDLDELKARPLVGTVQPKQCLNLFEIGNSIPLLQRQSSQPFEWLQLHQEAEVYKM